MAHKRMSLWDLAYLMPAPWDMNAPRPELVDLVDNHRLVPGRAIDMGCGTGDNAIYLASHGFDVVGIDISSRAIAKARRKAATAGVTLRLLQADVTDPAECKGPFDLVVDNGCLHSLPGERARAAYAQHVDRLTRPGGHVFLRGFVARAGAELRASERLARRLGGLSPGEVAERFGLRFAIDVLDERPEQQAIGPVVTTTYWLTRQDR